MTTTEAPPGPVLALDASGPRTSAALLLPGQSPRQLEAPEGERAGTALHGLIRELLASADLDAGDLTLVAAVRGPGSFTGLRVGLAAAQGLCLAAAVVGVGIETTAALAWATGRQGVLSILLDGGQGRLFAGRHVRAGDRLTPSGEIEDLPPEDALARVREQGLCFVRGDGPHLAALFQAGATPWTAPLAAAAGELAARGLASSALEPLYARAPAIRPRQP